MLAAAAGGSSIERTSSSVSGPNPNAAVGSAATKLEHLGHMRAGGRLEGEPDGSRREQDGHSSSVFPGLPRGNRIH